MSVRYSQSMQSNGIIKFHNTTLPIQFKDWVYRYNGEHFATSCLVHVDCFIMCLLFKADPPRHNALKTSGISRIGYTIYVGRKNHHLVAMANTASRGLMLSL